MAKKNFKSHIEDAIEVKVKKYLYVIRPAGMFVWLLHSVDKNTGKIDLRNFEIDFMVILDAIKDHMSSDCFIEINRIINKKKTMNELDLEPRISCIDNWIDSVLGTGYDEEMKKISSFEKNFISTNSLEDYDNILFSILNI
jgi:predicted nucleotidyltransferase